MRAALAVVAASLCACTTNVTNVYEVPERDSATVDSRVVDSSQADAAADSAVPMADTFVVKDSVAPPDTATSDTAAADAADAADASSPVPITFHFPRTGDSWAASGGSEFQDKDDRVTGVRGSLPYATSLIGTFDVGSGFIGPCTSATLAVSINGKYVAYPVVKKGDANAPLSVTFAPIAGPSFTIVVSLLSNLRGMGCGPLLINETSSMIWTLTP